jgi:hypothetical protein
MAEKFEVHMRVDINSAREKILAAGIDLFCGRTKPVTKLLDLAPSIPMSA